MTFFLFLVWGKGGRSGPEMRRMWREERERGLDGRSAGLGKMDMRALSFGESAGPGEGHDNGRGVK